MQNQSTYRWIKGKRGSISIPLHPNPVLASYGLSATFVDRFWERVEKTEHCWFWKGPLNEKGYGHIARGPEGTGAIKAHRASWIIHFGIIPDDTPCVLHDCRPLRDCPYCVNPSHLWLGTVLDNNRDMDDKGVRVLPPRFEKEGHPMAKLTEKQITFIREAYTSGRFFQRELAEHFGVNQVTISRIVLHKNWI